MSITQKIIYFGRPPLEIYGDGQPKTDHNYGTNFVKRMFDLGIPHVTAEHYLNTQRIIPGRGSAASDEDHVFHSNGATILYQVMPGRELRVELTYDKGNSEIKGLEGKLLDQKDLLPPEYNEIKK